VTGNLAKTGNLAETGLDLGAQRLDFSDEVATFGDRLTYAREAAGLSADELAARAGVRPSIIRAWEEDRREPRGNQLQLLSGMLNVSMRWLLTGAGDQDGAPRDARPGPDDLRALIAEMAELKSDSLALARKMGQLEQKLRLQLRDNQ
jgi:transcriptional regulator with XRE-family HTH domain